MIYQKNAYPQNVESAHLSAVEKPLSPVAAAMEDLARTQNEVRELISALEDRLWPVLGPQYANEAKADDVPAPVTYRSPICEEVEQRLLVELDAAARVRILIDRLSI